jgi:hypothetical protein
MTIDLNDEITGSWFAKYINTDKLISILSNLPKDTEVACNKVGNLNVYEKDSVGDWYQTGWINLADEIYENYNDF